MMCIRWKQRLIVFGDDSQSMMFIRWKWRLIVLVMIVDQMCSKVKVETNTFRNDS